jgi:hypothetical protein
MSIPRYLLSSSVLSGAVFCAATVPMLALDSQPLEVIVDGEPKFVGQGRDLAAPYLGLATAASLGMGVMTLSVLGWSKSSSKIAQSEDELAKLRKDLKEKESLIEQLRFSDARLEAAGLGSFIDDDDVHAEFEQPQPSLHVEPVPAHTTASAPAQRANPPVQRVHVPAAVAPAMAQTGRQRIPSAAVAKPPAPPQPKFQQAPAPVASSPSHTRRTSARPQSNERATESSHPEQLNDLLTQIQHIMTQVEQIQQGATV